MEKFSCYTKAMNTPIQGTGADIIKLSMIKIDDLLRERNPWSAEILLTVHDELITQCDNEHREDWSQELRRLMEEASTEVLGENLIEADPTICFRWVKDPNKPGGERDLTGAKIYMKG